LILSTGCAPGEREAVAAAEGVRRPGGPGVDVAAVAVDTTPARAAALPRDEAFGTFGRIGADGSCAPPPGVLAHWLHERDEYLLVTVCLRDPAPPHIEFRLRDDGARWRKQLRVPETGP